MEKRNIELTIETAQRWVNGTDEELKSLALQTFPELGKKRLSKSWEELGEKRLSKSWEELGEIKGWYASSLSVVKQFIDRSSNECKNTFNTKEQAEASIALAMLSQLKAEANGYWEPDWNTHKQDKFVIFYSENNVETSLFGGKCTFLAFKDAETRDEFLENHRELIEQAKPLLS